MDSAASPGMLYHEASGKGPLLVLLHAVGLQGDWWKTYVGALRGQFRVVTIDLAGHGKSALNSATVTLSDHARGVEQVVRLHGEPAHVVGVSMGGMVAQTLAIEHSGAVASLCLLSTMATVSDPARQMIAERGARAVKEGMKSVIEPTVERWVLPGETNSAFAQRCREQLARNEPKNWSANWKAISELHTLDRLGDIQCPTFICTGIEDQSTTPAMARVMAENIKGSKLELLGDIAHLGAFEHPERFLPLLRSHLPKRTN